MRPHESADFHHIRCWQEEHAAVKRRLQEDKAKSFKKKMNEFNQSRGEEQEDLAAQLEEKEEEVRAAPWRVGCERISCPA